MPLSDFQKILLTSSELNDLFKQMQSDATRVKDFFELIRLRAAKYNKISAADASTHLGMDAAIITTLGSFRSMLNEFVQIYDGDITAVSSTPAPIVEDMYSIIR